MLLSLNARGNRSGRGAALLLHVLGPAVAGRCEVSMFFDLTEDQKQFQRTVERVLTQYVDLARLCRDSDAVRPTGRDLDAALTELGVRAILVSEQDGGLGLGLLTLAVLAESLGAAAAPSHVVEASLAAWIMAQSPLRDLAAQWTQRLLAGGASACLAFDEPAVGWSLGRWRARKSDSEVVKINVVGAEQADFAIVGLANGLAFVERQHLTLEMERDPLDLTRPLGQARFAPAAAEMIGGPELAQRVHLALLVIAAADAVGAGRQALRMSVEYAKMRQQFQRPIGSFQGLRHQLANMALDMEPARYLVWFAAHAWDAELPPAVRAVLLAKAHATEMAVKTGRAAVLAHGGIGYTWEYPLHFLLKRAMQDFAMYGVPRQLRAALPAIAAPML